MTSCHRASRRRRLLLSLASAAAGLFASLPALAFNGIDITGAEYARDFQLADPTGKVRTLADFRGRAVLVFFGFTQCPYVCPTALLRAAEVMKQLGPDASRVQVIFVTIDPERDTPAVLANYTRSFHPSFIGLRGSLAATAETARQFKVVYNKVPTGRSYTMDHSTITYAFDPKGRVRLAFGHDLEADAVSADVRQLLRTP